jgi:MATE family multidrug resistance protein
MMVNFIDTWMVSMLGTAALAAIAPATLLLFAISCLGMGTAQGVQTFVAQADGRGEPHRAGPYVWQSIYIALISAILTSPIVLFLPTWFDAFGRFFGHPPDVLRMQIQFLTIALWSVAPATACAGIESFYNGIKKPIIGFIAVLASLVTVIVGNYALIFGHWGFPALGIAGSAYATILSWCVRLAVVMTPLFFWKQIDERYHIRRSVAFDPAKLGELVRVGGPISAQWLVDIGAWVVFQQVLMPSFGPVALAAMTIAIQCMHLAFMPALGVGMALTTQVGNAIGAGEPDRAAEHVRVARRVIIAYMGSVAALFLIIPGPMSRIFTQDPTVISATAAALIWCACFQISDALCITYSFALRGAGDTRAPAVLFAVCCWGIFVVGGWLVKWAAPQIGEHGPWIMCMSYIIVLSGLLWWRFASGAWRKIRLFGEKPADAPAFPAAVEEAEAAPVATGSP